MNRFVEQYTKLLFIRANAEHKAEHKTKQVMPIHFRVHFVLDFLDSYT